MSVFLLPAMASLILKLFVLFVAVRSRRVSIVFLSLICVFAVHNAIELIGYVQFLNNQSIVALFRLYYVAAVFSVMYILLHGLAISRFESTITTIISVVCAGVLSLLLLFTDSVIAGQYSIGYSVTAIKGAYYWLFVAFVLVALSVNIAVLLYRYRSAASQIESIRCLYSLFALSPIFLVSVITIGLKIMDSSINAAALSPIASALFLVIMLKGESKHKLSDIRRFLPFSPEREISSNIMELVDGYVKNAEQADAYKNLQAGIEREIVFYTLGKCDNNVTKTAEMMGLKNRSTLYSMMGRLNIDHHEAKAEKQS